MVHLSRPSFSDGSIGVYLTDCNQEGKKGKGNPQKDVQVQAHNYLKTYI
jgi:hypothetical protein